MICRYIILTTKEFDMKMYVQDHGVYGVIIVAALNLEEAQKKMSSGDYYNYDKNTEIQEFDLEGFEYCNLGDC